MKRRKNNDFFRSHCTLTGKKLSFSPIVLISLHPPTKAIGAFLNAMDFLTAATAAGERHTVDSSSDMVKLFDISVGEIAVFTKK